MDPAVGLVQAYLQANGYLTITEYPIVEALDHGGFRAVTDIDVIALRLPGAARIVPHEGARAAAAHRAFDPDPALIDEASDERPDLIIAEVKEGRAELNRGAHNPMAIITAIRRVAFVKPDEAEHLAAALVRDGHVVTRDRRLQIRLFAFGGRSPREPIPRARVMLLHDCVGYLVRVERELAGAATAAEIKNPTMSLLSILERTGALCEPRPGGPDHGEEP